MLCTFPESINSLYKIVQQQNEANRSAFAEIKVATTKLLRMETSLINYFPVTSTQGLQNLEENIRDDNRELFVSKNFFFYFTFHYRQ